MKIEIEWEKIETNGDDDYKECLYAYLHPKTKEILYIGKADSTTVRERWKAEDKEPLKKFLSENGIEKIYPIIGFLVLPEGKIFSSKLLNDIESLLIFKEKPKGNIKNTQTRNISRPGMEIRCKGEAWPGEKIYIDKIK
jgi:hypothetical protein